MDYVSKHVNIIGEMLHTLLQIYLDQKINTSYFRMIDSVSTCESDTVTDAFLPYLCVQYLNV